MDDFFINNKQLIAEVKKRPELYDVTDLHYYNRNNRDEKWIELFQVLVPHWDKLSPIEQQSYGLSIKKKWRSMRDSFAKDIRKRTIPSLAAKSRRYIYYNQMKFILPALSKRKGPDGIIRDTSTDPLQVDEESSVESENDAADETPNTNNTTSLAVTESCKDEDKKFLLSLLPLYKSMKKDAKLVGRIKMLEALRNVIQENCYDAVRSNQNSNGVADDNITKTTEDGQGTSAEITNREDEEEDDSRTFSPESLYHKLPAVWKVSSPLYKNKEEKGKAYDVLVQKCKQYIRDADRDFVRNKINSLRSSFRKEHKKVKASQARGDPIVHMPNLWYYNLLVFTADQDNEDCMVNLDESSAHSASSFIDVKNEPSYPFMLESEDDPLLTPNEDSSPPPAKKHRGEHQKQTQNSNPVVSPALSTTSTSDDIFEAIGKNVAHKLRRMVQQQRIIAEKIIGDVMYHGQMEMLTVNSHLAVDK